MPGTLTDRVLEPGGAASCPLMAGSPGLSLPKGGGCSGGAARLYSGGDERYVRGRSTYQPGSGNPVGVEDEGRGQRAVANGRANDTKSSTMRKCGSGSSLKGTVGHDERARGGAHVHKSPSGFRRSASGERWRGGNTVRPPRGLPG
jgi:hypothetical protein